MNLDESNLCQNNRNVCDPEKIMTILQLMYGEILEDHPMHGPSDEHSTWDGGIYVRQYQFH